MLLWRRAFYLVLLNSAPFGRMFQDDFTNEILWTEGKSSEAEQIFIDF